MLEKQRSGTAAAAALQVDEIKLGMRVYSVKLKVNGQWSGSAVALDETS
jgi:hypothetical protein